MMSRGVSGEMILDSYVRQCVIDYLNNAHKEHGSTCCVLLEVLEHVLDHVCLRYGDGNHDANRLLLVRKVLSKLRIEGKIVISSRPVPLIAFRQLMENDRFVYMSLQHHNAGCLAYGTSRSDQTVSMYSQCISEGMQLALLKLFREPGPLVVTYHDQTEKKLFIELTTSIAESHGNRVACIDDFNEGSGGMSLIATNSMHPLLVIFGDAENMTTTDLYKSILQMPTNDVKLVFIANIKCMTNDASFIADLCRSPIGSSVTLDGGNDCPTNVFHLASTGEEKDPKSVVCAFLEDLKAGVQCTWIRNLDVSYGTGDASILGRHEDGPLQHSELLACIELASDDHVWDFSLCKRTDEVIFCCDALEYIKFNHSQPAPEQRKCQYKHKIVTSSNQLLQEAENEECSIGNHSPLYLCITNSFEHVGSKLWYKFFASIVPRSIRIVATQASIYKQFSGAMYSSQKKPVPYTCLRKFLAQNSYEYQD